MNMTIDQNYANSELYDYDPISLSNNTPQSEYGLTANDGITYEVIKAFSDIAKKDIADVAQVLLPSIAAAAQKSYEACFYEPWGGFPISLYTLTFSESGNGKTKLVNLITKAIKDHDSKEGRKYALAIASGDDMDNPIILTSPTSTIQALAKNIRNGRKAQAIITDEAGRFIGGYSFIPENRSRTATDYADAWSGQFTPSEKASDGKLDGLPLTGNITLGLLGQSDVVLPFFNDVSLHHNGMLPRFLVWQSHDVFRELTVGESINKETAQIADSFHSVIERLLSLNPESKYLSKADGVAEQMLINVYNNIGKRADKGGDLYAVRAFANRYAENAMRIASVIAILEKFISEPLTDGGNITVTADNVQIGLNLMDSYLKEFQRLRIDGLDTDKAKTALTWYERMRGWETKSRTKRAEQGEPNILLGRDITQRIKDYSERNATIKILTDHGYLIRKPSKRGEVFEINMTVNESDRLNPS